MFSTRWYPIIVMLAVSLMWFAAPASAQVKGQIAPAFELADLTGQVKRVDATRDHRGKLIVFFTSW